MIRERVSVRDYQDKFVSDDIIKELIISACQAPSAGNQQPWEFYIVRNKDILNKLSEASPFASCVKKANVAVVLAYEIDVRHPKYVLEDMSACCQNLLLEIENQGLGGVWLGISPDEKRIKKVNQIINLDEKYNSFAIIPFGYPKEKNEKTLRFKEEKIHYIR